jgi:uncharacterized protein (DUF3820 family)
MLTDNDKILLGKYHGNKLVDVPASYLLWLWDQEWFQKSKFTHESQIREYIQDNLQVLRKEIN